VQLFELLDGLEQRDQDRLGGRKSRSRPVDTTGFSASSLSLSTPTTLRALPEHQIYHVDLVWTLSSGP